VGAGVGGAGGFALRSVRLVVPELVKAPAQDHVPSVALNHVSIQSTDSPFAQPAIVTTVPAAIIGSTFAEDVFGS